MTKKVMVFVLFLMIIFVLCVVFGKTQKHKHEKAEDEGFNGDGTIGIVIALDLDVKKIDICIFNNSDAPITCGLSYEVQVFQNNRWELYAKSENINSVGIEIKQGSQYSQLVDLDLIESGTYRIVKKVGDKTYYSNEITIK
ncbi:MAG: hypothetical protein J1E83_01030 [Lachnospiraceae bacterium]|nr:hypothetical protein [Lachnospiraceae bacterium]